MLFRVCVTLTPVTGGWDDDQEERLVGGVLLEAETFREALEQCLALAPDIVDGTRHSELNRRTFR